jgi:hypothetical protein
MRDRIGVGLKLLVLLSVLAFLLPPVAGTAQERIVNKGDADMIFAFTRQQWNEHAKRVTHPGGWEVRLKMVNGALVVGAVDPTSGIAMSIQPHFMEAAARPWMIVVGSYYPAGKLRIDERFKRRVEEDARLDLGPGYSVDVAVAKQGSYDTVEVLITKASASK